MKPKAPKKVPIVDTATVLAAWLAVVVAAAGAQAPSAPIPFAYAAE